MTDATDAINFEAVPSGTGCLECDNTGGWWFHLRRCAKMRADRLLRLVAVATRKRARRAVRAPDRHQLRAR